MKHSLSLLCAALLCGAPQARAADVAPATGTTTAKAASGPTAKVVTHKPGAAPAAGGDGGGLSSNSGNTGVQIGPKKPKCPDPTNTACPAVKAPVKTGG